MKTYIIEEVQISSKNRSFSSEETVLLYNQYCENLQ